MRVPLLRCIQCPESVQVVAMRSVYTRSYAGGHLRVGMDPVLWIRIRPSSPHPLPRLILSLAITPTRSHPTWPPQPHHDIHPYPPPLLPLPPTQYLVFSTQYSVLSTHCSLLSTHLPMIPHHPVLPPTPRTPHSSLLTPHSSLLTPHYSPPTPHSSPLTTHYSLLTTHYSLLTIHYSLLTTHYCSPLRRGASAEEPASAYLSCPPSAPAAQTASTCFRSVMLLPPA